MSESIVTVLGAGLAGCEAAWQIARRGVRVRLVEMKPHKMTPAHHAAGFAELCCSNSLRSDALSNAVGLLKEEMRRLDSLILQTADATRVPAGSALAVDREAFSRTVTAQMRQHPLIEIVEEEATEIPAEGVVVVATGPLTSEPLAAHIAAMTGEDGLYFYDAVAPIVDFASINMDVAFFASRYDKGDADYINCPMDKEQYDAFYQALISAREAELKEFDKEGQRSPKVFEGCMPVEVMARRGYDTLRYGPLKPVGLIDKRVGREAFAVVQLRKENREGTMYNLVGFQTHLTFPEQKRVFSMIPGLENANFLRYGVMHRNTYLHSPGFLDATYAVRREPRIFFAGQMTGVEGYIESAGSGLVAGINAARRARGMEAVTLPRETMLGAMAGYVGEGGIGDFSPMNANFGIVPLLDHKVRGGKAVRNEAISARALERLEALRAQLEA
ncbi:MAG: methylenetetrahydrofolate--tRNA-(uracil(54)-C(5))-methyltransferase (FADH(2)-oxidizing) TrmFO [Ruminococcaceae bacterium]|nr:methylenetetrahydrofolate--tRNA-(uracil(54)-C(5))-methyltransferase (FADH(2)-oxidizing) TrmFO [Oscillospiraceae bacterium]